MRGALRDYDPGCTSGCIVMIQNFILVLDEQGSPDAQRDEGWTPVGDAW